MLWFTANGEHVDFYDPVASGLLELVADRLGVNPQALHGARLEDLGIDSLDVVELVLDLEDHAG